MSKTKKISRYPIPNVESLPLDLQAQIIEVQEKAGFVPNVFLALAHWPKELSAFLQYHAALMEGESGLTPAEKEMIVVATSGINNCQYCVIAHGAILRIRSKNPLLSDQLAINFRKADISDKQMAMLEFAVKVCEESSDISDQDLQQLRDHGFNDEEIWDIASIASFFALSNRMANFAGMRPNDDFYTMGRQTVTTQEMTKK